MILKSYYNKLRIAIGFAVLLRTTRTIKISRLLSTFALITMIKSLLDGVTHSFWFWILRLKKSQSNRFKRICLSISTLLTTPHQSLARRTSVFYLVKQKRSFRLLYLISSMMATNLKNSKKRTFNSKESKVWLKNWTKRKQVKYTGILYCIHSKFVMTMDNLDQIMRLLILINSHFP